MYVAKKFTGYAIFLLCFYDVSISTAELHVLLLSFLFVVHTHSIAIVHTFIHAHYFYIILQTNSKISTYIMTYIMKFLHVLLIYTDIFSSPEL